MSITAAMEEAYASIPNDSVIVETLQFDHATFAQPVYVCTGYGADISLPLVLGGTPVLFVNIPFSAVYPGHNEAGPQAMRLHVSDVAGVLTSYLESAIAGSDPISVTYRAYTTADLSQPGDVIGGLFLRDVDQSADGVEGTLAFREIDTQAFPLATYDSTYYPALQS